MNYHGKPDPDDLHRPEMKITDLELMEFTGPAEYDRFRHLRPIRQADIDNVDWSGLLDRLQTT